MGVLGEWRAASWPDPTQAAVPSPPMIRFGADRVCVYLIEELARQPRSTAAVMRSGRGDAVFAGALS